MTVCPKCGKALRDTQEVCDACGTPLQMTEAPDPFAAAAEAETALREKSLRKLNAGQDTELCENTEDNASGKPKRRLRVLAVSAALAAAAGGSLYGVKQFRSRIPAGWTDLTYYIGSQPYFRDGKTGKVYALPAPSQMGGEYFISCVVSADRSRIFFPDFKYEDSADFEICYLELGKEGAEPVTLQLTDGQEETDYRAEGFQLLDDSGSSVLIELSKTEFGDSSGEPYAIWQEPALHDGVSLAMPAEHFVEVYPLSDQPGSILCLRSEEDEEPVYINKRAAGGPYKLELFSGGSFTVLLDHVIGWNASRHDGWSTDPRWLLCYTAMEADSERIAGLTPPYQLTQGAWNVTIRGKGDGEFVYSGEEEVLGLLRESLDSPEVSQGDWEFAIRENGEGDFVYSGDEEKLFGLLGETHGESPLNMLQSECILYGSEVHRVDLSTGAVSAVFSETDTVNDMIAECCLPNGDVWRKPENSDALWSYSKDGKLTELPVQAGWHREEISWEQNIFLFTGENGFSLLAGDRLYPVDFSPYHSPEERGLYFSTAAVSESGDCFVIRISENELEYYYLFDLRGLGESDTVRPQKITEMEYSLRCGVWLCGREPVIMETVKDPDESSRKRLTFRGRTVSENAVQYLCCDETRGVLFFTEQAEPAEDGQPRLRLCCCQDGAVTQIADNIVPNGGLGPYTIWDKTNGSFAFVRRETETEYRIWTADRRARSFKDCRPATDCIAADELALYRLN